MRFVDFLNESLESNNQISLSSSIEQIDKSRLKNQIIKSINDHNLKYISSYITDIKNDEVNGYVVYKLTSYNESYKENSGDKSELKYMYKGSYKYIISSNKVVDFDESTYRYRSASEIDIELKNSDAVRI